MKKLLNSLTRFSWALLFGGVLLTSATSCSTGTSEGDVNIEESDFKDKSPTENNPEGLSDDTQDDLNTSGEDSSNQAIYDQQEEKARQRGGRTNQGVGGAAQGKTTSN